MAASQSKDADFCSKDRITSRDNDEPVVAPGYSGFGNTGLAVSTAHEAPKDGWGREFPVTYIDEEILQDRIQTKRHRIEGWNLFREDRVLGLRSSSKDGCTSIYFKGQCGAAMRNKSYTVNICLKDGGKKMAWGSCTCPAGVDGQCKHCVAVIHYIIDIFRQGVRNIPEPKTCTQQLQVWHVKHPLSDEPLLVDDMHIVKHDPFKFEKRKYGSLIKEHNPVPNFANVVSEAQIKKYAKLCEQSDTYMPIMDIIKDNNFQPHLIKSQPVLETNEILFKSVEATTYDLSNLLHNIDKEVCAQYVNTICIDLQGAKELEKHSRVQSKSNTWYQQRAHRLTASLFGTFIKISKNTDPIQTFRTKRTYFASPSTRHGVYFEQMAFNLFLNSSDQDKTAVGLIVNPTVPFLGASPDRVIVDNEVLKFVEIKCPYSIYKEKDNIQHKIESGKFYIKKDSKGDLYLSPKHDYYYQIQGQLNIAGVSECILLVFVPPLDILTVTIKRDKNFFVNEMLPKLSEVYFQKLLPNFFKPKNA